MNSPKQPVADAPATNDFYQRCVIAGMLVLSPKFVNLAGQAADQELIKTSLSDYGIDPGIFKASDSTLGFTPQQHLSEQFQAPRCIH